MKAMIDAPIAQLILDLEERGLLDRTLIVLASEFSPRHDDRGQGHGARCATRRACPDRIDELKYYGMHRHFTDAGCVLLFGGGMKRGYLHGVTADERPCKTIKDPVDDRGPARHHLPRAGHPGRPGLRGRAAALLRDARREGEVH